MLVTEAKQSTSPTTTSVKTRPLSPRFIPIDSNVPSSPKSSSAQVSPVGQEVLVVRDELNTPSNNEQDKNGAQKLPDTVVASSAL